MLLTPEDALVEEISCFCPLAIGALCLGSALGGGRTFVGLLAWDSTCTFFSSSGIKLFVKVLSWKGLEGKVLEEKVLEGKVLSWKVLEGKVLSWKGAALFL